VAPDYAARVRALIGGGNLVVGPYYCQPDWQLSSGELLIHNLLLGQADVAHYGGVTGAGWLVDTFGHIRQSPQLHQLFGLGAVYVWRGVPELLPAFWWEAPDGSRLLTINLFGGYRNLYGVTHVPELAGARLQAEIAKLCPFYQAADIPLFDGYDLEDNPEDPVSFYRELSGIGPGITIREATPTSFAAAVRQQAATLPSLRSELNSGKYGATFPGALSTRTYLKVMAADCERLLFGLVEPLAALAWLRGRAYDDARYDAWSRLLLQNAVHDCLCGVSIDLVHEKMEDSYRRLFDAMSAEVQTLLPPILAGFAPGIYGLSTQPFAVESWQPAAGRLWRVRTNGVGITPVDESYPVSTPERAVESFVWRNDHYEADLAQDGMVRLGAARLGQLLVFAEHGDTYSEQKGRLLGALQPSGPLVVAEESEAHTVLSYEAEWQGQGAHVAATVRIQLDRSPLIRWQVDLDSCGSDLRVEMRFATAQPGSIWAGMPFDVAPRPVADEDLLPRQLPPDLTGVLLGQRELHRVSTFPFHDFVAVSAAAATAAVFARGLHAYSAAEDGAISLLLRRSVEWVTKSNLPDREGDAGPAFYVPDARCERAVRHELAFARGDFAAPSPELLALNGTFQYSPLLVRHEGSGSQREWQLLNEALPLSRLRLQGGQLLARIYNPTTRPAPLAAPHQLVDVWGAVQGETAEIGPYAIATLELAPQPPPDAGENPQGSVTLLNRPRWRVGASASRPDPAVLGEMERQMVALEAAIRTVQEEMDASTGAARLRLEHRYYVLKRKQLELQLSHLLNERRLARGDGPPDHAYLYERDEQVATLGLALNRLRIKRRIFDYVVQAV
jgi:alpha-mannosidase